MKKFLILIFLLSNQALATELKIRFTQLNFKGGNLLVNIFQSDDGFPEDPDKAYFNQVYELREGVSYYDVIVPNMPEGVYGIAVVQDLNKNLKLDKNFLGIPREPFGFSNNPRVKRNIKFDEVSFEVKGVSTSQVVLLNPLP